MLERTVGSSIDHNALSYHRQPIGCYPGSIYTTTTHFKRRLHRPAMVELLLAQGLQHPSCTITRTPIIRLRLS